MRSECKFFARRKTKPVGSKRVGETVADPKKLPYLIKLLDDDSAVVREAVIRELSAFGPSLEEELASLAQPPGPAERRLLRSILDGHRRQRLKSDWPGWFPLGSEPAKLEAALSLLADYQSGSSGKVRLKTLLDKLAFEYETAHPQPDPRLLAEFLFHEKGFAGAQPDYHHPDNSNLVAVVERRRGIPISLACVYILVGTRLGLTIEGCNFPGHFLARVRQGETLLFVDCYRGGRFLSEEELIDPREDNPGVVREILRMSVDAETIVARVLHNLVYAYEEMGRPDESRLMRHLLDLLDAHRR